MNNLIRLSDGQALIVADDPWQLYDENLVTDAALILPLQQWRERQATGIALEAGPIPARRSVLDW